MSEWRVELVGERVDLDELHKAFNSDDPLVIFDQNEYFLKSKVFETLLNVEGIRDHAAKLVEVMNYAAVLHNPDLRPVAIGSIILVKDDGKREIHAQIHLKAYLRCVIADSSPNPENQSEKIPHGISSTFKTALNNKEIIDALHFYSQKDWINLYKVYEIIRDDLGGDDNIRTCFDITKDQLNRFTQTAQSRESIGDQARHAANKFKPHPNPMPIEEARAFMGGIIQRWLSWKSLAGNVSP